MEAIVLGLSPFVLNGIMGAVKWFAGEKTFSTAGKRGILAIFSVIGAVAFASYSGTGVDIDSITSLTNVAIESFVMFLLSHGSYTLFWKKKK